MKKRVLAVVFFMVIVSAILLVLPPFLLPQPVYEALYGWRYPKEWSCGDARIVDLGPATANNRFIVDLGSVPVGRAINARFRLCDLPEERLFLGLTIPMADSQSERGQYDPLWHRERAHAQDCHLALSLTAHDGSAALEHSGPLTEDWTWSGPNGGATFVYSRGLAADVRNRELYDVEIRLAPKLAGELEGTRLVLHGGGWK